MEEYSLQELESELARRERSHPSKKGIDWEYFAKEATRGLQKQNPLTASALGAAQSLGDIGASLGNLPSALQGQTGPFPHPQLKKLLPEKDNLAEALFTVGEFAAPLGAIGKGASALSRLTPLRGKGGMLATPATSAATGYAIGEIEDETGQPYGRELGALLGGGIGTAAQIAPKNVLERIGRDYKKASQEYSQQYEDFFKDIRKSGANKLTTKPKIAYEKLISDSQVAPYTEGLQKFNRQPTLETLHEAVSDLKKYRNQFTPKEKRNLHPSTKRSLDRVENTIRTLEGTASKHLIEKGHPEFVDRYKEITRGYAQDVIPYGLGDILQKYRMGRARAKPTVRGLGAQEEFMTKLGEQYPEIKAPSLNPIEVAKKILRSGQGEI